VQATAAQARWPGCRPWPWSNCWLVPPLAAAWSRLPGGTPGYGPTRCAASLFASLALPVLGLVLVEQLFRNLPEDAAGWPSRCAWAGVVFAFDVYLYSEGRAVRPARPRRLQHPRRGPCWRCRCSSSPRARRSDWHAPIQVSRRAAFYSATLLLIGPTCCSWPPWATTCATSAATGAARCNWGCCLPGGAAAGAGAVGSLRARLRVFVGKHFFSYRYDYREEWLRFTAMLSSSHSPAGGGRAGRAGLANMVECPAGSLWTRRGPPVTCRRPLEPARRGRPAPTGSRRSGVQPSCRRAG
jgi:hypothetical protein